jgi:hypothetical protein
MMDWLPRRPATRRLLFSLLTIAPLMAPAVADDAGGNDLRDIRIGRAVADLPKAGYANFACANETRQTLTGWSGWRDCPADATGLHAVRFGYNAETDREGTIVAGHPAILTLLVDNAGTVSGLRIETDPKARLYIRKKAFLFGIQVKSRYGLEGWTCTQARPEAGEQPVGGVYVRERCTKTTHDRSIVVERNLFRKPDQDMKNFVDETRMTILRTKD